ncbi:hypothetical protein PR003_g18881 [Phytophthora rubi]|uniref:Uncharacterized protein n=1 Tax=Phytophthora rubi TaxID=129364 RepID=A0A6A3HZ06_9STRA|nr:hypothetical protein PR002_g26623 [Phytophthora rubi]KAE8973048.1 hypothetical protein PR001_g26428 [Phytophthora rubi]KAE9315858.1 hypothetical protein PR003_g18881 [Phytophthora rubi]
MRFMCVCVVLVFGKTHDRKCSRDALGTGGGLESTSNHAKARIFNRAPTQYRTLQRGLRWI